MFRHSWKSPRTVGALFFSTLAIGAVTLSPTRATSAEPAACLSQDMSQWPAPSKPYFMIVADTSGSMSACTNPATVWPTACPSNATLNSCGMVPTRVNDAKCALRKTIAAFSGEVNFGLASFSRTISGCPAACNTGVSSGPYLYSYAGCTFGGSGCSGANVLVPMLLDTQPAPASNVPSLNQYFDHVCSDNKELFAYDGTPIGASLQNILTYYQNGFQGFTSPITATDRACRSLNVILLTDGGESCGGNPVTAAQALYNGFTKFTIPWSIKVHVIGFSIDDPGDQTTLNNIAKMGQCGATSGTCANGVNALAANNEATLSTALAGIIAGSVKPETCDNADNNCNGCTDEGYNHYCDQNQTCCSWGTDAQRTTCLNTYKASITTANPKGDLTLLPCTTPTDQTEPLHWLCYNPAELCDNIDNNCNGQADEGFTKCGSPLHCPQAETCNGQDDDCDGVIDNGVCGGCVPSPEVCDGCDNDCDGFTDNGVASITCGFTPPAQCAGTMTCKAGVAVPVGTCVAGGGWNACQITPGTETCNSLDDNCDGIVDNNVASVACVPTGTPGGLVYTAPSTCKQGTTSCVNGATVCNGFVGPGAEICDGLDNNCDGQVDNGVPGVGLSCGVNAGECKTGTTACVNGAIVCQGGVQPQAETCNGKDDNCNGQIDDAPLADAPGAGLSGCWTTPGSCGCTFLGLSWCPPTGATCNGNGSLQTPCNAGTLTCQTGAWACVGAHAPAAEACNNIDDNCDGTVDNGISQVGQPCGTDTGECTAGTYVCQNGIVSCQGSVAGTPEQCNGKDDNCDGLIDNAVQGLGMPCGNANPPCTAGVTACVNGQVVCSGGTQPKNETCNGVDDNCDGVIDNPPLADAPTPGHAGCWTLPGTCCSFGTLSWCFPTGADCDTANTLTTPCQAGTLTCTAAHWACLGAVGPQAEACDNADNNCDGVADNVPVVDCVPAGTPAGLVYGGTSQCKRGTQGCGSCAGFVGPSTEICDGIDNDCNGAVDDGATGQGTDCGINIAPCTLGKTACVNGVLICQGGTQPQPEVCDGIDNNCNGSVDESPLSDAPLPGQNGCWMLPGTCCSFANPAPLSPLTWCAPTGANCTDNGTLPAPCNKGFLACGGATGWKCLNAKQPSDEVCDAIDNNCDGQIDNGIPAGAQCGTDVGECEFGTMQCVGGVNSCVGQVTPVDEICDGLDNNCNNQIDDGIPTGGPCEKQYDTTLFPGDRTAAPCQPGVMQCNGSGGTVCIGGVSPAAEVCDGIDNDCDGLVDEENPGTGSDTIVGTTNPKDPTQKIGDPCGQQQGTCIQGKYGCLNGIFQCIGDTGPQVEVCDCKDNDCDGTQDNSNGDGGVPICSGDKKCVKYSGSCLCAQKCGGGEIPCPGGTVCKDVNESSTGEPLKGYCVPAVDPCGGGCADKKVPEDAAKPVCAPAGFDPAGCTETPVCVCRDQYGCQNPCAGITCSGGKVCPDFGPKAGTCVEDNCWNSPCTGCGKACNLGACVDNPCVKNPCPAGKECKPSDDFTTRTCVDSCAGKTCTGTQVCVDGLCVAGCATTCPTGQVCDLATKACVGNKCVADGGPVKCTNGGCCDPLTGECGNCPCEGVVCPTGQKCENGQCKTGGGTGGSGGSGGTGGTGGGTGKGGSDGGATGGMGGSSTTDGGPSVEDKDRGVIGLATGGGGCMCGTAGLTTGGAARFALAILGLLGLVVARRRSGSRRAS